MNTGKKMKMQKSYEFFRTCHVYISNGINKWIFKRNKMLMFVSALKYWLVVKIQGLVPL